ncbi:site-specific DNA-methyltransferase [Deinococcus sp. YIM 134068]|uniref:site-specific DNA-methyltransferase n=1 Tax=Deinococcus lichenicola TaxID=3118910 RepID=UPI002F939CB7
MSQPVLLELPNEKSAYKDTAFASNKTLAVHRWVNWIAGFSSEFVQHALELHLPEPAPDQVVLDPFGGVGTAPLTAFLRGHSVVSYDINPFPVLVQRAKLKALRGVRPGELLAQVEAFGVHMAADRPPRSTVPPGFTSRTPFYSERVLVKVLRVWDFIYALGDEDLRDLFRVAFGATMVSYSNYSYEPSLGSRAAAGKPQIEDADVAQTMRDKLMEMHGDLVAAQGVPLDGQTAQVYQGSFMRSDLAANSVDLIVTSPPYLNNYHYLRNTRPHLYWLGFASKPKDLRYLELDNYGKYWQTVRDARYRTALIFESPWLQDLTAQLAGTQTDRGVYGGQGWANYATEYFNDTYRFLQKTHEVLRPGSKALIVVGNSIVKGINLPVDEVFTHVAGHFGFTRHDIHVVRDTRIGSSIVGTGLRVKGKGKLYEVVVELTK